MNNRGRVLLFLLLGLVVCVGGFFGVRAIIRGRIIAPFKPHLAEYLAAPSLLPVLKGTPVPDAKMHGKMIVVNYSKNEFDDLYFDLPDSLAAKTPEEVGVVVTLQRSQRQVGTYSGGGGGAYVQVCSVTVADKETKKVFATRSFTGGNPPTSKKSSESGVGSSPDKDIVAFLTTVH